MRKLEANKISDEDLIKQITETNNTQLFSVLYDRYASLVYNKCYGFSKSKEEAQDLTHDVFIKLFVKLRTFKGNSKFSTWLYSFTYNFCVNYVQRNANKKKEKVTVITDQIKEDSNEEEIDDAILFELKWNTWKFRNSCKFDKKTYPAKILFINTIRCLKDQIIHFNPRKENTQAINYILGINTNDFCL